MLQDAFHADTFSTDWTPEGRTEQDFPNVMSKFLMLVCLWIKSWLALRSLHHGARENAPAQDYQFRALIPAEA